MSKQLRDVTDEFKLFKHIKCYSVMEKDSIRNKSNWFTFEFTLDVSHFHNDLPAGVVFAQQHLFTHDSVQRHDMA